jgi:hypothetical protein
MKREDIPTLSPIPQNSIALMRENVAKLEAIAKREWPEFAQVTADKDRVSFLDGMKATLDFGQFRKKGSGYVCWDNEKGWLAQICRKDGNLYGDCDDQMDGFSTLREALDAFVSEYEHVMGRP